MKKELNFSLLYNNNKMNKLVLGDHRDYQTEGFNEHRLAHYRFVIYTRAEPELEWLDKLYPIHIVPPTASD